GLCFRDVPGCGGLTDLCSVLVPGAFMEYFVFRCVFNSSELNDIEFIESYCYNKKEYARFSSSVGKYVGYTEFGVKTADYWNSDTSIIANRKAQRETYCQHNIGIWYQNPLTKSGEYLYPSLLLIISKYYK
uniref:MHC class II beta chain N-terminal domain-containing protein n=1 Tax=Fundulus heteroclitus TaxID=8078 RepID=A0A3Q2NSK7_FUNHE